jgi:hypothetical protein
MQQQLCLVQGLLHHLGCSCTVWSINVSMVQCTGSSLLVGSVCRADSLPGTPLQGPCRVTFGSRVGKATTCTFLQLARNKRTVPYLEFRD